MTFIVGQLVSNAVKYHSDRHPQLRFSLRETRQAVFLEVWDNGKGIAPEDLPEYLKRDLPEMTEKHKFYRNGVVSLSKALHKIGPYHTGGL